MRLVKVPVFALLLAASAVPASAYVATFAATDQKIMLTGLGGGQDRVTWGSCVFSGGTTTCTVTANFTGFGGGGTIAWVLTYSGNGPSPLTTGSVIPGSDQLAPFSLSAGSFITTITANSGSVLTFYGQAPLLQYTAPPQCTVVTTCSIGQVGLVVNATITGQMSGSFDTTPVIRSTQGVISASSYGAFPAIAPGT